MSEPSDFESLLSDVAVSPCSSLDNVNSTATDHSKTTKSRTNEISLSVNDKISTYDSLQHGMPLTDSDHSLLEAPKLLNASSPSSICSIRPLEWDSGADVGYDIMPKLQSQDMSTIERIAVSSLVYNSSSMPFDCEKKKIGVKTKSNSLINLNGIESSKGQRSASFEALKCIATKSDTLPKCRSPMASSQSVSTIVHKIDSLNIEHIKQLNKKRVNLMFEQRENGFDKLNSDSNKEQNSSESSKESNSTLGSADTAGSWVAKEFRNSNNTTTDRVNSFEYLPGNAYYNSREDGLDDYLDKEIKQSTKMLVEAMKQNGLTDESQRKEIFKEIIESFLKIHVHKDNNLSVKNASDSDQTPVRQDFTSLTSNTANTVVNNQTNNHSSTITFSSPITSSRYGDEIESKYDESSMDSGRHINLQKCKTKKLHTPTYKQRNQCVQCTIQDTDVKIIESLKQPTSAKSNTSRKKEECLESSSKKAHVQSKTNYKDVNKEFKKQMVWFHKNYMKTERENQMLWINNQISHLNNLKKLFNTHEELKKNWNSYKQKQKANNKSRGLHPVLNSSSDITTTTKTSPDITTTTKTSSDGTNTKIDSTISSKQFSVTSRSDGTDVESSSTVCNHVHYKKGILVDELKSMKNCCEKTLHNIEEKEKQQNTPNELKNTCDQTGSINKINLQNNSKRSNWSNSMYIVDHQLKPISNKSSITYDIIFKPTSRRPKEIDNSVSKKSEQQKHLVSVACQTNKIPLPSLQEYLITNRPDYVCRAEERQNILTNIAKLRDERKNLKRNMLITHNYENKIPPNPLAIKRVMSQKEMRKLTERKYRKCPEVKNKKVQINRKEEYKINKIMVNIFNKRLQKKTLKGKVDLSNSISVSSM